ncbi:ribulose-phosphate 3-epimerase [Anaerococcus sp. AGMB00486]|uniref:Ribulose-phosphate 3-epimerase n=2 Tax=Anaerococcus TaxID=165779 RepID=A0ABX2N9A3_9FIRM|nr:MULTISPECIES: ribulose-phosphate 3-epimerase [Anaerococcus]MDY3006578.1 ribulose-phosphate 3-epimerase [Anaerococcus porci]MSS77438.1 ribulose-phosphate 3-epimerase [Anaerococcus porci]NVF11097.1 ribulose-phosphate 3-epimerase [Anaerococcus faecalis]
MKTLLSPSIMCANLLNLEKSIDELKESGFDRLHIDVIDGAFAPSMPLGLETIKEIRKYTDMYIDVHIMSVNNEYFIKEMINLNVDRISFHEETSVHVQRYIDIVKNAGIEVGVALTPARDESVLKYVIDQLDSVLIMMINPGYATNKNEGQIKYGLEKIKNIKEMIDRSNSKAKIQLDGRVSTDKFNDYISYGARDLVLGSKSLYKKGLNLKENRENIIKSIKEAENGL